MGKNLLGIEGEIAWAVPGELYVHEKNLREATSLLLFLFDFLFRHLLTTFSFFFPTVPPLITPVTRMDRTASIPKNISIPQTTLSP
jgi:hypothetical protein